jgi:cytochrome c553
MVAHALATDELWQGLMGPSDARWAAGARTLIDAPALDSDVPDVAAAAHHLRDLAQRGTTVDAAGRARLFGDVLLTCATCHERVGVNVPRSAPKK